MRKILICAMLLVLATGSYSQSSKPKHPLTYEDYMRKRNARRADGWFLLIGGAAVVTVTAITSDLVCIICPSKPFPYVPISIGGAMMAGSIPLFIRAGSHERKARSLSFKNESIPQLQNNSIVYSQAPSLSFKVNF